MNSNENQGNYAHVVVSKSTKSPGIALLLTFLFGPLGMFYSTILGAVIMIIISAIVGFVTLGLGLIVTWPICMIWGAVAASMYNKKLMAESGK